MTPSEKIEDSNLVSAVIREIQNAGFNAMRVGGCVRDKLLKIPPRDYDIATDAKPDDILQIFSSHPKSKKSNLKAIPTGEEYGTITIVGEGSQVEVTTLRQDVKTYGRRAEVAFGESFKTDAERRDFTMNALFEDQLGHIYDFTGGYQDIKKASLRFIGEPKQRIEEDYLRILRFFRFWAQTGFNVQNCDLEIIKNASSGLIRLSVERITQELLTLLIVSEGSAAILAMIKASIFDSVLPEIPEKNKSFEPSLAVYGDLRKIHPAKYRAFARLALLYCHNTLDGFLIGLESDLVKKISKALKLSNKDSKVLDFFLSCFRDLSAIDSQADFFEFFAQAEQKLGNLTLVDSVVIPLLEIINDHTHAGHILANEKTAKIKQNCQKILVEHLVEKKLNFKPMPINNGDVIKVLSQKKIHVRETSRTIRELNRRFWNEEWQNRKHGLNLLEEIVANFSSGKPI